MTLEITLKVGELAKRSGLTVRALHHYDSIGLLCPLARSEAGYRLYNRADIARLHQIQALRRFGVALADIGTFLASPGSTLPAIVAQQIAALTRQIEQAGTLRAQLTELQGALSAGAEPDLAAWLTTLELMNMYDKYFTKQELSTLPLLTGDAARLAEWDAMVGRMKELIAAGTPPADLEARALARQWMTMLERDTCGNPDFMVRLLSKQAHEPAMRAQNGITPDVETYMKQAFMLGRLAIFEKYLSADEYAFMKANAHKRAHEYPLLVAHMRKACDAGADPASPAVRQLALQWLDLSRASAGDAPTTQAKLRLAYQNEPDLRIGSWIDDKLQGFLYRAMSALHGEKSVT